MKETQCYLLGIEIKLVQFEYGKAMPAILYGENRGADEFWRW